MTGVLSVAGAIQLVKEQDFVLRLRYSTRDSAGTVTPVDLTGYTVVLTFYDDCWTHLGADTVCTVDNAGYITAVIPAAAVADLPLHSIVGVKVRITAGAPPKVLLRRAVAVVR